MKLQTLAAFATTCGVLIAPGESHAAYLGLATQLHTTVSVGFPSPGIKSVFRIYAVFSDPDDFVLSVGGTPESGPATIKSLNATGDSPGSNFFNPGAGGDSAPPNTSNSGSVPVWWFDTFATIGLYWQDPQDPDDDQTTFTPLFPTFIGGKAWGPNTAASWYLPDAIPQGQAGGPNGVPNVTTDFTALTGTGIMIMQLTVNAGGHVAGTVAVNGISDGESFTATAQTFASFIPAPGPLAALALALAAPLTPRRRRT